MRQRLFISAEFTKAETVNSRSDLNFLLPFAPFEATASQGTTFSTSNEKKSEGVAPWQGQRQGVRFYFAERFYKTYYFFYVRIFFICRSSPVKPFGKAHRAGSDCRCKGASGDEASGDEVACRPDEISVR